MTSFSNFSAKETLSTSSMNMVTGGFDMNVVAMLKNKYANVAGSQQFSMVSKCCTYTVTLDATKRTMSIKSAMGGLFITKY